MKAQELFLELKDKIRRGELTGKLPSIAEFVRKYHISHNTVKKVLDMLKMQQLVYGQQGRGVYVRNYIKQKKSNNRILIYCDLRTLHNTFYLRLLNMLRQKAAQGDFTIDLITDIKLAKNMEYLLCFIVKGDDVATMRTLTAGLDRSKLRGINLEYRLDGEDFIPGCHNDNFSGGYMAVEHLYKHGHRNIGVIACAQELPENIFHYRLRGAENFASLHPDCHLVSVNVSGENSSTGIFDVEKAIDNLRTRQPELTAIFAFTDFLAMQSMHFLQQSGVNIPDDISIIGYDNKDFSGLLFPALTTVEENAESFADAVCRVINEAIAGRKCPDVPPTPPDLIERASVSTRLT